MKVKLLNPEEVKNFPIYVGYMANICYDGCKDMDMTLEELIKSESSHKEKLAKIGWKCLKSGHVSPSRGFTFKFYIEGISRACSHQLVRHSVGFYPIQMSQRYVVEKESNFVIPESIKNNKELYERYCTLMDNIMETYQFLLANGVAPEDSRYVLPNAWGTKLNVALTFEAFVNLAHQRLCSKSQWEIRELVKLMKDEAIKVLPELREFIVPKCIYLGKCNETKPCNKKVV